MENAILDRVLQIASECSGIDDSKVKPEAAIDQDIGMVGSDLEDFVSALAEEFGDHVWDWPWQRFAIVDEGLGCYFLPALIWQLLTWPFRGSFGRPNDIERLELRHISAVLETGKWFEP